MKNITSCCLLLIFCVLNSSAQTPTPTAVATVVNVENLPPSPQPSPSAEQPPTSTKPYVEKPASPYARKDGPVKIPRFENAPVIDGQLNDAVWQRAALFGDFVQTNPGDNVAPTHPTEFMMGYDAKNLYMAFRIKQDKNTVRATVARRDNIFNDDYVLVHLDTFNDQR
ncbi:MAG TPA: hypothetical protein VM095_14910, partial [Pyrinomonadaceae bacterium]|nr:hypothetical protein [Pyrinomonadaceae bacterium]